MIVNIALPSPKNVVVRKILQEAMDNKHLSILSHPCRDDIVIDVAYIDWVLTHQQHDNDNETVKEAMAVKGALNLLNVPDYISLVMVEFM